MAKDADPTATTEFKLAEKIINGMREAWCDLTEEINPEDPVLFARLSVLGLLQLSAIIAVDVGITSEQFLHLCRLHFDEFYKKAPKFS